MRLTPADVHNVAFKKPSIGKRGYDEDEVDAFLDLVEAELSRLIEENNDLGQRVAALQNGGAAALVGQSDQAAGAADQPAAPTQEKPAAATPAAEVRTPVSVEKQPEAVAGSTAAPAAGQVDAGPSSHHLQAAKLLGLAEETAERLTSDAAAEAAATRSSAEAESQRVLAEAKAESERLLADAQGRSTSMVDDATAKAEALERDSRVRADAMDREAQSKYVQVTGNLTEQRTMLEKKIDDLRIYEREYRTRLKSWIADQLSQLDESGAKNSAAQKSTAG